MLVYLFYAVEGVCNMANNQFVALGGQAEIATAAEAERQRIRAIEALGHEFRLSDAARVLSLETNKDVAECRRILGLLVKAGEEQKALASRGWDRAYDRAKRIIGRVPAGSPLPPSEALPGMVESGWARAIALVNEQSGLTAQRPMPAFAPRNKEVN